MEAEVITQKRAMGTFNEGELLRGSFHSPFPNTSPNLLLPLLAKLQNGWKVTSQLSKMVLGENKLCAMRSTLF